MSFVRSVTVKIQFLFAVRSLTCLQEKLTTLLWVRRMKTQLTGLAMMLPLQTRSKQRFLSTTVK